MLLKDVDRKKLKKGEYCQKGVEGCFCKVGWPYEEQCPDCRDTKYADVNSYCGCPPSERILKELEEEENGDNK